MIITCLQLFKPEVFVPESRTFLSRPCAVDSGDIKHDKRGRMFFSEGVNSVNVKMVLENPSQPYIVI